MTGEQKKWLDDRRAEGWEAIGFNRRYSRRGLLHPDGDFEDTGRARPRRVEVGSFEVGVRKNAPSAS